MKCIHGLVEIGRCQGKEVCILQLSRFPIVLAYNSFVNGVDRHDQLRAGNSTTRREHRVPMSTVAFFLNASVMSCYEMYQSLMDMDDVQKFGCAMVSLREF